MPVVLHWFLPTTGDSRSIVGVDDRGGRSTHTDGASLREPGIDYLIDVARAAERNGFTGVLTPTGTWCEDAWLTTAAISRETTRLKFLVAFRPGSLSPTLAAQMAATFQRISGGRLMLNIVTGSDSAEQRRFGDWLGKDERYARTGEFLTVLRGAWNGPFDFDGEHFHVAGAHAPRGFDAPPIYFGGSSRAALDVATNHADVYLTWGEPPAAVAAKIAALRELGYPGRFGIRLHVITRDTSKQAWAEANALLDALTPEQIATAQASLRQADSVGQQRMLALHGGTRDELEIYPNLWAGVGLVRPGAGTALVGSHTEVADRIAEYHDLGIDEFILSGYPHLEEAYHAGEGLLPELRRRGLLTGAEQK
ncbi:alkanesulfonate monooxygenase [Actinoplanes lobatus]|uniref:Alkanesulfonate monooxygenase n=1 Tax=Actinoplanes lobatus TaxID=113568 RepID=A0A7W7HFT8_9ACTN|nr:LLM class flavin-dependent oxidoreductase [Actinoplanes lobatus]MBB4749712.1 alkanesulfonate monooxygenase [Actinoplanes lobatus]GGN75883.1 alkanesulfonate monooxygenase [Actinoplanes lobatus]GIE38450.1 alkanesulfonate monooxygenase [Actinoplanes lobatus]